MSAVVTGIVLGGLLFRSIYLLLVAWRDAEDDDE